MDIFSLFPRPLTAPFSACIEQGYSSCGTKDYRHADGTSFSAPQVAAAAALLFGEEAALRPDQVSAILKQTADDATRRQRLRRVQPGPGPAQRLRPARRRRGARRAPGPALRLPTGSSRTTTPAREAAIVYHSLAATATLDWWDDPNDVYRIHLVAGQRLSVLVHAGPKVDPSIVRSGSRGSTRSPTPAPTCAPAARSTARARPSGSASRRTARPGTTLQVKLARPGFRRPYRIHLAF